MTNYNPGHHQIRLPVGCSIDIVLDDRLINIERTADTFSINEDDRVYLDLVKTEKGWVEDTEEAFLNRQEYYDEAHGQEEIFKSEEEFGAGLFD